MDCGITRDPAASKQQIRGVQLCKQLGLRILYDQASTHRSGGVTLISMMVPAVSFAPPMLHGLSPNEVK
jgi:hypothetical protein